MTAMLPFRISVALTLLIAFKFGAAGQLISPRLPVINLPMRGGVVQGFTATVEIAEHDIAGYVPVEIVVTSTARFTADRRFLFQLSPIPNGRTPPDRGLIIDIPISVDQGSKTVQAIHHIPKWSAGSGYSCVVFEDGIELEDYFGAVGNSVRQGRRPDFRLLDREMGGTSVFVHDDNVAGPVAMAQFQRLFAPAIRNQQVDYLQRIAISTPESVLGQNELPSDWRGYQRFDLVILTPESLARLTQRSEKLEALRKWILVGGAVLCIDAPSPEALSATLEVAWTDDEESRGAIVALARDLVGGQRTDKRDAIKLKGELENYLRQVSQGVPTASVGMNFMNKESATLELRQTEVVLEMIGAQPNFDSTEWGRQVWVQRVGGGLVIGFRERLEPPSMTHWQLVNSVLSFRRSPMLRRGVDPLIGDGRFTRWMIPGVAQPPVYTFIGLLTVFVVLVGPIAYRRTTKYGRGYLMFAIAPMLAMVTTLAMFGYGVVADGFGIMARVRQVTWIDGASGDAGERVRSTYFAGVRPGDGLRFPREAEVIAYPQSGGRSWEDLNELSPAMIGNVRMTDQSQVFDQSFLPSREQRQFVTQSPRMKTGTISIQPGADPNSRRVSSTLGFALDRVIARDSEGNFWACDDLAAGATAECQSLTAQEASKALGDIYNAHRPISAVREARTPNRKREIRDLINFTNRNVGDGSRMVTDGAFEQWLVERLRLSGDLPNNFFVATAPVSKDVLVVDEVDLVDSIRYVIGTLP